MSRVNRAVVWANSNASLWGAALCIVVLIALALALAAVLKAADTAARQAQEQAIRVSTSRAAVRAQYERCYQSTQQLPRLNEFLTGVNAVARAQYLIADGLVDVSARTLAAAPANDPLLAVRRENLGGWLNLRSDAALAQAQVSALETFPVPTEAECARESGIPRALRHR